MALSDDMVHWRRYREAPVLVPYQWHGVALIGDPQVVQIGDVWVMFFWNTIDTDPNGRFDSFACSYDLVNWTKWRGQALTSSTTSWDYSQATKPWVIKHDGVVYHFYNAQGEGTQFIGLATSVDLRGDSKVGDVAVSASHTFAFDTPTALVDEYGRGLAAMDAFNSPNTIDWVQFDFAEPRRLDGLTVHIYSDNGGVQPPRQMYVEYLHAKKEWEQATGERWEPTGPRKASTPSRRPNLHQIPPALLHPPRGRLPEHRDRHLLRRHGSRVPRFAVVTVMRALAAPPRFSGDRFAPSKQVMQVNARSEISGSTPRA